MFENWSIFDITIVQKHFFYSEHIHSFIVFLEIDLRTYSATCIFLIFFTFPIL